MRVLKNSRSSRFSDNQGKTQNRCGLGVQGDRKQRTRPVRWSGRRKRCRFQCVPISGGSRIIQLDPQWTGSSLWFTHT
ncbi:hypothetical protein ATANTOWER_020926 [Ataeniobius toweri]|uniref:Uncharacterized protein n=1 Tax=Ataeniobius toweri TaxID=208326 RepID=A0ABU7BHS8_9TELE|nr:hypothetical protein [Ataeniobius toweri]